MQKHLRGLVMGVALCFGAASQAFSAPADQFFTTSDGVKLHYIEEGQGPWLFFIPGWTMPADIWEKQIAFFAKDCHVIALDPRCQGESQITDQGLNVLRRSQDIQELIQFLKADKVVLVGWSMGGSEALAYLKQFGTQNLTAVVLVEAPTGMPPSAAIRVKREAFLKNIKDDRVKETEVFVRWMYAKTQSEDYYERIAQASLKTPTDAAVELLRGLYAAKWRPDYSNVKLPMLGIYSGYYYQGLWLQKQLPGFQLENFSGDGHALFVDDPDLFNQKVHDFLTSVSFFPATPAMTKATP
jgi:microsomal epoxide hydrolase